MSPSALTSHAVPLPAGSAVGDWVILAASNQSFGAIFTLPGTVLLNAGYSAMRYGLCVKQLDSTDISAGTLLLSVPSAQQVAAVCVGYYGVEGFNRPGTVWAKPSPMDYTNAPAVASDGTQDILVFSLTKQSATPPVFNGNTPSTTTLQTALKSGSGMPSAHVSVYTGSSADRTSSWDTSSSNGVGFQVSVLPLGASPVTTTVLEWDEGTIESAGGEVSGMVTVASDTGFDRAVIPQDSLASNFQWYGFLLPRYTLRSYITMPSTWASSSMTILCHQVSGGVVDARMNLSGTGAPGQVRLYRKDNVQVAASSTDLLIVGTVYRWEMQVDTVSDTLRGAVFELGSDTPIWDSGLISGDVGAGAELLKVGKQSPISSLPEMSYSRVLAVDTVGVWLGRHATDTSSASTVDVIGVWNGSSVESVELLGSWNGTSVDAVETIDIT